MSVNVSISFNKYFRNVWHQNHLCQKEMDHNTARNVDLKRKIFLFSQCWLLPMLISFIEIRKLSLADVSKRKRAYACDKNK